MRSRSMSEYGLDGLLLEREWGSGGLWPVRSDKRSELCITVLSVIEIIINFHWTNQFIVRLRALKFKCSDLI